MENPFFVNSYGGIHGKDVATPLGRVAFVYLAKPNEKFNPVKYGVTLLVSKDDESGKKQLKEMADMCQAMQNEFCLNQWNKLEGKKRPGFEDFKAPLVAAMTGQPWRRDGDLKEYDGFENCWVFVAKNANQKEISFLDGRDPAEFEAGMICRLLVQPYCDAKGFSYKLRGIRLIKDDGFRFKTAPDAGKILASLDDAVEAVKMNVSNGNGLVEQATEAAQDVKANIVKPKSAESQFDVFG